MPYRGDREAQRLRCELLEGELGELRLRVGALAAVQRDLVVKERELADARRRLGPTAEPAGLRRGRVLLAIAVLGAALVPAGLVAAATTCGCKVEQIKTTKTSATELRKAAEVWRSAHPSEHCPTPETLRADKMIDPASKLTDAWDGPFLIRCEDDETRVISTGRDKMQGTADDISVPPPPPLPR